MSEADTRKTLPRQVDPRKLALNRARVSGSIAAAKLLRLSDAVSSNHCAFVDCEFYCDERRRFLMHCTISCDVVLTCQRCLQALDLRLESDSVLAVISEEGDSADLPSYFDPWIVQSVDADLYSLVEEELLLSLPVVALHNSQCIDEATLSSGEPVEEEKPNPFQALSQLKIKKSSDGRDED